MAAWLANVKELTSIPDCARDGIAISTRREHIRRLRHLAQLPERLRCLPVAEAILRWMEEERHRARWKATTWAKLLGSIAGACKRLTEYTGAPENLELKWDPLWADAVRQGDRNQKCHTREKVPPATFLDVDTTIRRLLSQGVAERSRAAQLALMWSSAARPGCTLQLKKEDLILGDDSKLFVLFRRGKAQNLGKPPLPVHTLLPQSWRPLLDEVMANTPAGSFLWPFPDIAVRARAVTALSADLGATRPGLKARSVRSGCLIHMLEKNVAETTLLQFSGHSSIQMLREYTGYGENATHRATGMRTAARHLTTGDS